MTISIFQSFFVADLWFSRFLQSSSFSFLGNFFWLVTYIGNLIPFAIILCSVSANLYFSKQKKASTYLFWSTIIGVSLSSLIKLIVARPRPSSELVNVLVNLKDFSFPSSHCLSFTIFFGFLYFYITTLKKQTLALTAAKLTLLTLIFSIGFSRVYLGAHWFSDCLGGYILGYLILKITTRLYKQK